ncbi:MAG: hypothetical protein QXU28_05490 [Nitrososphaerota archaeon]
MKGLVDKKVGDECAQIIGLKGGLDQRLENICKEVRKRISRFEELQQNGSITAGWVKQIRRIDYVIAIGINIIVLFWYLLSIIT